MVPLLCLSNELVPTRRVCWREAYGEAATFLSMHEYEHVGRWVGEIDARPGVLRGRLVNSASPLAERHDASDFDTLPPEKLQGIVKGF